MRRIITIMAVLVLLGSGCGDDSATGGERFDSGAGADSNTGDGGSGDGGSGDGGSDDGGDDRFGDGSNSDFCNFNEDINTGLDDIDPFNMGPEDMENSFRQMADNIDRAVAIAPDEIRGEVQVLVDGVSGFMDILAEYDYDMFAIPEEALNDPRMAAVDDPRYEEAVDAVNAFCGFDDVPDSGTDGGVPDAPIDPGDIPAASRDMVIQSLQLAFGWDDALAACVVDELELDDPTGIDPSVFGDLNAEVCGQSVQDLFGG